MLREMAASLGPALAPAEPGVGEAQAGGASEFTGDPRGRPCQASVLICKMDFVNGPKGPFPTV